VYRATVKLRERESWHHRRESETRRARGLAIRNHFAEVSSICAVETFGLEILDLAGAQNFHGDAAGFTLDVEKTKERNIDLAFAGTARFSGYDEPRVLPTGSRKVTESSLAFTSQSATMEPRLIDGDFVGDLNLATRAAP